MLNIDVLYNDVSCLYTMKSKEVLTMLSAQGASTKLGRFFSQAYTSYVSSGACFWD